MKIAINSGFQRGGSLWAWDGGKFILVNQARENTYVDDGDSSFEEEVADDFRGAEVRFYGVSAHTRAYNVDLLGFSEEELDAPAPAKGFRREVGVRTERSIRVESFREWLLATVLGTFTPDSAVDLSRGKSHPVSGNIAVPNGFEWGDQRAAGWDVFSSSGEYLYTAEGCGDHTPSMVEGDLDWEFPTQIDERIEWEREEEEERAERFEAICFEAEEAFT